MGFIVIYDKVEKSPNTRARCRYCGNLISKGTPRVAFPASYKFSGTAYMCYKCAEKRLKEKEEEIKKELNDLKVMKVDFDKIMEECSKELIVANL